MLRGLAGTAVLLLALTACGTEGEPSAGGAAPSTPATASDPAAPESPTTSAPAAPAATGPLTEAALLGVDEVPRRDRLTPWRQAEPLSEAVLACQSEPLSSLGAESVVRRTFVADIAGSPAGDAPASAVDLAVLEYADAAAAATASDAVSDQVRSCSTTLDDLPEASKIPGSHPVGDQAAGARWWQRDFLAPDVCTECDAVRFHRMAVGSVGPRVVLVSLAEIGGPMQPEGLDPTMESLVVAALARATG